MYKSSVVLVKLVEVLTDADASDKMKHAEKYLIIRAVKRGQAVSLNLYQTYSYIRGQTQSAWDFFFTLSLYHTRSKYILFQRMPSKLQASFF